MCGVTYRAADDDDFVYFACGFLVDEFLDDVFTDGTYASYGDVPVGSFGHDGLERRGYLGVETERGWTGALVRPPIYLYICHMCGSTTAERGSGSSKSSCEDRRMNSEMDPQQCRSDEGKSVKCGSNNLPRQFSRATDDGSAVGSSPRLFNKADREVDVSVLSTLSGCTSSTRLYDSTT